MRSLQDDRAVAAILGLSKGRICGEDAFVRMMSRADREAARTWMAVSERDMYSALPPAFIADWDSTVNTHYGHQEEVEVGYNPHKPGRGSHHPLLCVVAGTRLALHMEWRPGNAVIGKWHIGLGDGKVNWNGKIKPSPLDVGFGQSFIMAATNDRVPCVYVDGREIHNLDPKDPLEVVYGGENPFPEVPTGRTHPELLEMKHSDQQHFDTIVNGVGRIGFSRGGKAAQWNDETMTDVFLTRAKDFISEKKDEPFFLYYALHQPHVPRIPSPRFAGSTGKGPRGDVIAELDWCVGEILAHLKTLGLDDDTIVVFSSDNGPVLDDGYQDEAREKCGDHKPAGPLRGGKYSMFDGGSRVPMILRAPGRVAPGETAALFSHLDFLASFSHLAGIKIPEGETADSQDMSAALLGLDPVGRDHLVTEGLGTKTVVRQGYWVFIPPHEGEAMFAEKGIETGNSLEPQLYDLNVDIGQRTNLAEAHPDKVKSLNNLLDSVQGDPHAGTAK
jgi:arylsulfatase A-like enzyme